MTTSITYAKDTFVFVHHCDKDFKEFDCERRYNIYKRLHKKKCSECRRNKDIAEAEQHLSSESVVEGNKIMRMVNGKLCLTTLRGDNHKKKKIPRKDAEREERLATWNYIKGDEKRKTEFFEYLRKKLNSEDEEDARY